MVYFLPVVHDLFPMVYGLLSKSMVCGLWSISYGLWSMAYGPFPMVYGLWSKSMVYALLRGVAAAAGRKGTAARAAAVPGGERGGCHAMVQTMLWSRFVDVVCEFSMVYGQGLTLGAALMVVCVCVCVRARARVCARAHAAACACVVVPCAGVVTRCTTDH